MGRGKAWPLMGLLGLGVEMGTRVCVGFGGGGGRWRRRKSWQRLVFDAGLVVCLLMDGWERGEGRGVLGGEVGVLWEEMVVGVGMFSEHGGDCGVCFSDGMARNLVRIKNILIK